jgi:hypothetical protein
MLSKKLIKNSRTWHCNFIYIYRVPVTAMSKTKSIRFLFSSTEAHKKEEEFYVSRGLPWPPIKGGV